MTLLSMAGEGFSSGGKLGGAQGGGVREGRCLGLVHKQDGSGYSHVKMIA